MRSSAACLLVLVLAAIGCDVDPVEPIVGCESLSECPLGMICDPDKSKCVAEPNERFVGAFKCFVREEGDELVGVPGSEVLGRLGEDRWTLPVGADCIVRDSGGMVVKFFQTAADEDLTLYIGPESVQDGGKIELEDMRVVSVDWALFAHPYGDFGVAYSSGGFVEFYDDIELGELIEAYLSVRVVPAIDEELLLGVRCPRGDVDCGYSTDSRSPICVDATQDPSEPLTVCSLPCSSDADCGFAGGACYYGRCALPCETSDDCPGSDCYTSSEGDFCF